MHRKVKHKRAKNSMRTQLTDRPTFPLFVIFFSCYSGLKSLWQTTDLFQKNTHVHHKHTEHAWKAKQWWKAGLPNFLCVGRKTCTISFIKKKSKKWKVLQKERKREEGKGKQRATALFDSKKLQKHTTFATWKHSSIKSISDTKNVIFMFMTGRKFHLSADNDMLALNTVIYIHWEMICYKPSFSHEH